MLLAMEEWRGSAFEAVLLLEMRFVCADAKLIGSAAVLMSDVVQRVAGAELATRGGMCVCMWR